MGTGWKRKQSTLRRGAIRRNTVWIAEIPMDMPELPPYELPGVLFNMTDPGLNKKDVHG
jgi:hypothetical protein